MRKIAGPLTVYCGASAGSPRTYPLERGLGGSDLVSLQYGIRVLDVQTTSVIELTLKVEHGAEGVVKTDHSTPIDGELVDAAPKLIMGDAGSGMFLPSIHPTLEVDRASSTGEEWVVIEIYEMRKNL